MGVIIDLLFVCLFFLTFRLNSETKPGGPGVERRRKSVDPGNEAAVLGTQRAGEMLVRKVKGQQCSLYGGWRRERLYAT